MTKPRLSVIIPTHNRKELLGQALDSLAKVKHQPGEMEVIVVDDGSSDNTVETLSQRHDPFLLRIIRNEKSAGPAAARNRGAAAAQGEILGFLDSDIIVDPEWWHQAAPYFADPSVAGVEGMTTPPPGSDLPTPFIHVVANLKGGNYLTCNIFYRKQVFLQVGGFDERFIRANREDSDLAFSLIEKGFHIVFEPKCKVEHPLFPSSRDVYIRETRYGLHEPLLRRKHPVLYRKYLKWIDGRAFPIFYWGMFVGLPAIFLGIIMRWWILLAISTGLFFMGWAGSVYAVCRKRRVGFMDLVFLIPQFLVIPWLRLYWILQGEWKYRNVGRQASSIKD